MTGKPFPLTVIDISRLDTPEIIRWLMPIEECLPDISRARDWKGWFRRGRSLGIIYTEAPCILEILLRQSMLDSAQPLIDHCCAEEISISIEHVKGRVREPKFDGMEVGNLDTPLPRQVYRHEPNRAVLIFRAEVPP